MIPGSVKNENHVGEIARACRLCASLRYCVVSCSGRCGLMPDRGETRDRSLVCVRGVVSAYMDRVELDVCVSGGKLYRDRPVARGPGCKPRRVELIHNDGSSYAASVV